MRTQVQRVLFLVACVSIATIIWAAAPETSVKSDSAVASDSLLSERLVITYFHGNARCVTCRKLEAYAKEAVDSGFAPSLENGSIEWRLVNFDEDNNDHFLKEYQLFGQALILSYVKDGKEQAWKNLDKIWQLVKDESKYQEYVQQEITAFLTDHKK